jgi:hypothetical protein
MKQKVTLGMRLVILKRRNSSTEENKQNSTALPNFNNTHASIVKEVLPLPSTRAYNSKSRSKHLTHVKSRDREPSRIPVSSFDEQK